MYCTDQTCLYDHITASFLQKATFHILHKIDFDSLQKASTECSHSNACTQKEITLFIIDLNLLAHGAPPLCLICVDIFPSFTSRTLSARNCSPFPVNRLQGSATFFFAQLPELLSVLFNSISICFLFLS